MNYDERRAYILTNWQARTDVEMGDWLNVTEGTVAKLRQDLKLFRKLGHGDAGAKGGVASGKAAKNAPIKPKGYTAEQLAWATANATAATDDEARLMLVMHTGKRWVQPKVSA